MFVDRRWPRGVSKQRAQLDEWCNQVAPSITLIDWYRHDPRRQDEFVRRYRAELATPARAGALSHLRDLADHGPICLLTAAREGALSEAAVLAELLLARGRR